MLEFLDDDHSGTFAHDKSITVFIKWTGSPFGLVIAGAESFHVRESAKTHRQDGRLGTTADEAVSIAEFDDPPCFTDAMVGGRARGDDAMFGPETKFHGNDAAGDVGNHHRNGER